MKHETMKKQGFLGVSARKESACNAGDLGSIPGLGRSPWRRERQPIPIFWPGEFHGLYSPWGCKQLDTTQLLSLYEKNNTYKREKTGKDGIKLWFCFMAMSSLYP